MGDLISLQYGGSEAHKKMRTSQHTRYSDEEGKGQLNELRPTMKHKELLTSIRRYYSNAFTDRLKQDAMNVFLGNYSPSHSHFHEMPLWELESDYYLHNFKVQNGSLLSMAAQQEYFNAIDGRVVAMTGRLYANHSSFSNVGKHAHGHGCHEMEVRIY